MLCKDCIILNMSKITEKISNFILAVKERMLAKKLSKTFGSSFQNKTSKTILSGTETLTLSAETDKKREQVLNSVTEIMIAAKNNPQKMLDYIKSTGTKVYIIKNNSKLLKNLGEEDGFILPAEGVKAAALYWGVEHKFTLKTPAMFVFREEMLDEYYILQQFYKWYSYRSGLPGFDTKTQNIFKKYMTKGYDITKLTLEDTLKLQEAVARDTEATDFAIEVARLRDGGRNVLNKMKTDGGASI